MPQYRNDGLLTIDWVPDYATDITNPDSAILIGSGANAEDGNFVSLIGAKGREELNTVTGWEVQNSSIPLEGYAGPAVGSLAGGQTYPESSLTWLSSNTEQTIFDLMEPATQGNTQTTDTAAVVFGRTGKVTGGYYQLFPVQVASREISKGRNVPGTFTANFSLNAPLDGTFAPAT